MTATCAALIDQVQQDAQLAISEVFSTMLSLDVSPRPPTPLPEDHEGQVVSSVGFIGKVTGAVYLYCTVSFAKILTSRMLGLTESEVDSGDMINDALGELSNMVVGSVKSRLCDRGSTCTLTLPSIVRGQHLSVEKPPHVTTRVVGFRSGSQHFLAEIFVKEV
jgi:chemotaxis protein CheX